MTRTVTRYRDGEVVGVWVDGEQVVGAVADQANGPFVMPDIKPFATMEGVPISSRSQLRAYEQKRGVRQVGTDMKPVRAAQD